MDTFSILPKRTWLERIALTLAGMLVTIGLLSLVGWWLNIDVLLQPIADTAPLQANAALCFLLLGAVLLAVEFNRPTFAGFALFPALIGAVSLVEQAFERN